MGHRTEKNDQPASAEGVIGAAASALGENCAPAVGLLALSRLVDVAREQVDTLDLGAHSGMAGSHACVGDVLVTVVIPHFGQFDSRWCLACLEDSDPLDALHRLVPGASVSVRAGA